MTINVTFEDPCTCGSGIAIKHCCYKEINTKPPGTRTNYSHPKCYARRLCDCSKKISREHFLSKGVQALIGETAHVKTPFTRGEGELLKLSSLSANVLCERHNNALSPLDLLAKKLYHFLLGRTNQKALVIRGTDVEKWLLKLMLGMVATGHGQTPRGVIVKNTEPDQSILETLFGESTLSDDQGLMVFSAVGVRYDPRRISLVMLADGDVAKGFGITFGHIQLSLSLAPVSELKKAFSDLYHRPRSIGYYIDDRYREVHFGWTDGEHCSLTFTKDVEAKK